VDAVERLAVARREQPGDLLVGEDHQLLDEHVRVRLALEQRRRDASVLEVEDDLRCDDLEGAAREAPPPQLGRELVVQLELLDDPRRRVLALRLPVGEPGVGPDHRAVEGGLAVRRDLDGDRQPVDVRAQRAEVVGQLVREHRCDERRHVGREGASRGAEVERRPGGDEVRDVRDVHPRANAVRLAAERERVVEVLGGLRVDRVGGEVPEVDPAVERRLGRRVRLELLARALLDEQRLEHVLDPTRGAQRALDAGAAPAGAHDREVAGAEVAEPPRLEHDRHARREVRLAYDELSPPPDLDHDAVHRRRLRRR
jgi:hypothetical protein